MSPRGSARYAAVGRQACPDSSQQAAQASFGRAAGKVTNRSTSSSRAVNGSAGDAVTAWESVRRPALGSHRDRLVPRHRASGGLGRGECHFPDLGQERGDHSLVACLQGRFDRDTDLLAEGLGGAEQPGGQIGLVRPASRRRQPLAGALLLATVTIGWRRRSPFAQASGDTGQLLPGDDAGGPAPNAAVQAAYCPTPLSPRPISQQMFCLRGLYSG